MSFKFSFCSQFSTIEKKLTSSNRWFGFTSYFTTPQLRTSLERVDSSWYVNKDTLVYLGKTDEKELIIAKLQTWQFVFHAICFTPFFVRLEEVERYCKILLQNCCWKMKITYTATSIEHSEKDGGCTFYQKALRSEYVWKSEWMHIFQKTGIRQEDI
jgi:hypothetical protein